MHSLLRNGAVTHGDQECEARFNTRFNGRQIKVQRIQRRFDTSNQTIPIHLATVSEKRVLTDVIHVSLELI
ncbi:hypothetical protein BN2476_620033 [Paraburkholderia piptadeniae]|uniref:Uncharacterized protein n=1 Tax=Paraburkholderia piptadeniae TaxID=1701573 RepID=A0A1N7SKV9_9BURK|nr:hypothetical protein BN2476_620033 [Paraburkholderia piptadeniae]